MKRILFILLVLMPLFALAQTPSVEPVGTYYRINEEGEEETGDVNGQIMNAPFRVVFSANPTIPEGEGYNSHVHYEWTITNTKLPADASEGTEPTTTNIKRYEEEFELEFTESGSYVVKLCAIFYDEEGENEENIRYKINEDEDRDEDPKVITFSIAESKLEFPNGISPNDDQRNDVLKPKTGYKGIVEFHAAVFNRWGKKLYSWDDVNGCWDGKVNGKPVKDGVYFLRVSAKGSDGIDYSIKKAINVISGYNNGENEGSTDTTDE
ncbi:MAG: gliding motility-associated C-terminal domain-containing protein [Bacteroidaceae bacterium]|nr:gliding motility-associated C-terminal domain-containing protein [Bacteroidaceae bacterium]MBQ9170724.1 gliding motility-associated C-terminal domain-containing protein [Bacteroidaceae bacterium]